MSARATCLIGIFLSLISFSNERDVHAQIVSYQGDLTLKGGPVPTGFVIAGTFAPTFDPQTYKYVYGDESGNMNTSQYTQAVADGNFRPIGTGTQTFPDGAFTGSGLNTAGPGHLVYLFAFDDLNPDVAAHFALATSPSWVTGGSSLSISAANASSFVFGEKRGPTLGLQVLPFPEPSSLVMAVTMLAAVAPRIRRRGR